MTAIDWFLAWIERDELAVPLVVEEVRQDRVMFTVSDISTPRSLSC